MPEAAPWPVFGALNETALDGIAVNITEFLDEFGMGQDVEVVVAALPELLAVAFEPFGGLCLQGAEDVFELLLSGLAEQEVDVLGHKDVAEDVEMVPPTEMFESFEEDCAAVVVVEVRETVITTEGDKVVVAEGVITLETARHVRMIRGLCWMGNGDLGAPFMRVLCA